MPEKVKLKNGKGEFVYPVIDPDDAGGGIGNFYIELGISLKERDLNPYGSLNYNITVSKTLEEIIEAIDESKNIILSPSSDGCAPYPGQDIVTECPTGLLELVSGSLVHADEGSNSLTFIANAVNNLSDFLYKIFINLEWDTDLEKWTCFYGTNLENRENSSMIYCLNNANIYIDPQVTGSMVEWESFYRLLNDLINEGATQPQLKIVNNNDSNVYNFLPECGRDWYEIPKDEQTREVEIYKFANENSVLALYFISFDGFDTIDYTYISTMESPNVNNTFLWLYSDGSEWHLGNDMDDVPVAYLMNRLRNAYGFDRIGASITLRYDDDDSPFSAVLDNTCVRPSDDGKPPFDFSFYGAEKKLTLQINVDSETDNPYISNVTVEDRNNGGGSGGDSTTAWYELPIYNYTVWSDENFDYYGLDRSMSLASFWIPYNKNTGMCIYTSWQALMENTEDVNALFEYLGTPGSGNDAIVYNGPNAFIKNKNRYVRQSGAYYYVATWDSTDIHQINSITEKIPLASFPIAQLIPMEKAGVIGAVMAKSDTVY